MARLDRDTVKQIVIDTLKVIADLPQGNVESSSLAMLNDDQKQTFLSSLKSNVNAQPYQLSDGTTNPAIAYYDVDLTMDTFASWNTVGDCIDWVTANHTIVSKN